MVINWQRRATIQNRTAKLWVLKMYLRLLRSLGRGSETVMVASPNDPKKKVRGSFWYEEDGIPKLHIYEEEVYIHPTKTVDEWCKEWEL